MTYYVIMIKATDWDRTANWYWTGKEFGVSNNRHKAKTWKTLRGAQAAYEKCKFSSLVKFISER